ncbi:hypothetical protein AUEXF2481DRAFT_31506 [Aureobasidium subglaciale EXF-2481]|uniref:rRNA-processing protein FYV7 n=1 Tax=Aureobasidium subglaciale (strain EXF-2481) TaxID=1043005 RepID=A0A074YAR1_AURSE|nr:uncharacterized protein AUEXF2481DRAFT_31506 [Aureobasidium subglaciale EXF-2481]KAI5195611.1 hypothetical protein E4T38_08928 [Aureobasidium subglaciale]KAI5214591.1 hypothetical protein E4T40_08926 [Aureobasidium subglaciale]KAI5217378.1 hypothetical protein E4T41_08885 [Aureobasidium subglaciale]KAI5255057.1 hypothetical protein E4T46_08919 [Aureobasidium subglaciale]KEQ93049.1 hypothetical protein AUEXF2481DRAFT_31506 [Aureobasidium subglaciale EXF-2481]
MAITKRPRDEASTDRAAKKHKKSFDVGPRNLPDGTHRRKTIQIKRNLIEKAKLKKEYAKQKAQAGDDVLPKRPATYAPSEDEADDEPQEEEQVEEQVKETVKEVKAPRKSKSKPKAKSPSPEPIVEAPAPAEPEESNLDGIHHSRRQKIIPFAKEHRAAQRQKREIEERRAAYERSQVERAEKIEEREKFRKAMAKARSGGKNGQRKLGRESNVLLDRVKRMMQQG